MFPIDKSECFFFRTWSLDFYIRCGHFMYTSTTRNCQTKRISPHSKPYWTEELSAISRKMRKALKSYLTRNTDNNLEEYRRWKEVFDNTRKKALEDHLSQETSKLNRAQAEGFWRQLKRMTKSNTSNQIESLWNDRKEILSGNVEIEHEMFETFFETKHIKQNEKDFDETSSWKPIVDTRT